MENNTSNDYGLVSIIMPNYNSEKYIEATLNSVLAQTYTNWELLFVDDCSSDNSVDLVKKYNDARIKIMSTGTNGGAATARNIAIKEARGKWIAFLDSDDLWFPEKLSSQLKFMYDNDYGFSFTNYEDGEKIVTGPKSIGVYKMYQTNWIGCLTVMYDREKVGLIQIEPIRKRNDYALWLKVIKKEKCHHLDMTLASYNRHENSISSISTMQKIKWYITLFKTEGKNSLLSFILAIRCSFFYIMKQKLYVKKRKPQ